MFALNLGRVLDDFSLQNKLEFIRISGTSWTVCLRSCHSIWIRLGSQLLLSHSKTWTLFFFNISTILFSWAAARHSPVVAVVIWNPLFSQWWQDIQAPSCGTPCTSVSVQHSLFPPKEIVYLCLKVISTVWWFTHSPNEQKIPGLIHVGGFVSGSASGVCINK